MTATPDTVPLASSTLLLPDAGPLITLAYADALDLLLKPGWALAVVDMVLHEVTRHQTPTSDTLARWVQTRQLPVLPTRIHQQHLLHLAQAADANTTGVTSSRKSNLGELAIQETMNSLALEPTPKTAVFLFEDHKIARASFVLPDNCRKVSTRAYLMFLEQKEWIASAAAVERHAVLAGRAFSALRFGP